MNDRRRQHKILALLLALAMLCSGIWPPLAASAEDTQGTAGHPAQTTDATDGDSSGRSGGMVSGVVTPEEWVQKHTVAGLSPSNATINLFDYWVHEQDAVDSKSLPLNNNTGLKGNGANNGNRGTTAAHWWRQDFLGDNSINRSGNTVHPFIFAGITQSDDWRFGVDGFVYNDRGEAARNDPGHTPGRYNTYVNPGNGAYQGIVQPTLGADGYPQLALTDEQVEAAFKTLDPDKANYQKSLIPDGLTVGSGQESLAYLFDPDETQQTGKASYKNARGLLQRNTEGYYYYDSSKNFAEYDHDSNAFWLYDAAGSTAYNGAKGQFFPFNSVADFLKEEDGKLVQKSGSELQSGYLNEVVSHYFGLTMDVDFYQPDGGLIDSPTSDEKQEMTFSFSGDDDVWVYIDGVLIADLGGIHDAMGFSINFATGKVDYTLNSADGDKNAIKDTSLREMYLYAIRQNNGSITDSQGNTITEDNLDRYFRKTNGDGGEAGTFRSGTEHKLQFYYLERGNQQSNMSLSYNLVPPIADDVIKVDQDNKTMAGVGFDLYTADENYNAVHPLAEFTTGENGAWTMLDEHGIPFDFEKFYEESGQQYYLLHETSRPSGYRRTGDIHLKYDPEFGILNVENTWDTGAVGNFNAKIYQVGDLRYQNPTAGDGKISTDASKAGIILAVPLINTGDVQGDYSTWRPMAGSNMEGFFAVDATSLPDGSTDDTLLMRKRLLKAALHQIWLSNDAIGNYPAWTLGWSEEEDRYQGTLNDLPGTPDRYYLTADDTTADLALSYYFIDGSVFDGLGDTTNAAKLSYLDTLVEDAYAAAGGEMGETASKARLDAAIDTVADKLLGQFAQVNLGEFNRLYGSHIYIPNTLNTLAVQKLDENGEPMQGVTFGLYDTFEGETPVATGSTDKDGRLIFSGTAAENTEGQVKFDLLAKDSNDAGLPTASYWLHETSTLDGYELNDGWVPVYITDEGIYADALAANDGIQVYSGLGKLLGTMTRYAMDDGVNVTLRDLILTGGDHSFAENGASSLQVHYGLDTALLQYGTHEGILPVFITDEGVGYGTAMQNYLAHSDVNDPYHTLARKIDLGNKELSHLFTGSTTVVVRNIKPTEPEDETGNLKISKTVEHKDGAAIDPTQEFHFTVKVSGAADKTYNTDKDGVVVTFNSQGIASITLKHKESLTIMGLPSDATYSVTEDEANLGGYTTEATGDTGTISADKTAHAAFVNSKGTPPSPKTGALTIEKRVTGDGDKDRGFPFTVILTDEDGKNLANKTFACTFSGENAPATNVLTSDKNGTLSFELRHGQRVTISDLPEGARYRVEETNSYGHKVSYSDAQTGVISTSTAASLTVTNHKDTPPPESKRGHLAIEKKVTGDGDKSGSFPFTVTLTQKNGKPYANKNIAVTMSGEGAEAISRLTTDAAGAVHFSLAHGQRIVLKNLPEGVTYTVEETNAYGHDVSYEKSPSGTIANGKTAAVTVINDKETPPPSKKTGTLEVTKIVGGAEGEQDKDFHFTVTLSDASISGKYGEMTFKDGVAEFSLRHGQTKKASKLPLGTGYTVVEREANTDNYTTAVVGESGSITKAGASATFTNTKEEPPIPEDQKGNLSVSKSVSGKGGDQKKAFTFTITLSEPSISGKYGNMTFAKGVAKISLKHGESCTATGLPVGVSYTVTEGDHEGYILTASGTTGTITGGQTQLAAFNNHKDGDTPDNPDDKNPPDKNPPDDNQPPDEKHPPTDGKDTPPADDKTPGDSPETGDESHQGFWLALLAASACGMSVLGVSMRKNRKGKRK
ncbi:MAG: DUF5979 domain-containing protein [Peptococcaceae bacterium]|nr:DUF5979 domain-containing protein [Peptococcaceae bacterium]